MGRCLTEHEKRVHAKADKLGVTRAYAASLVRREEAAERAKPPPTVPLTTPREQPRQRASRPAVQAKPKTGK